MMTTTSLMAGASRFAHFAGLTRASRRAADDDQDDGKQGRNASDDDGDDDQPKGKKSRRAADDDQDDGKQGSSASEDDDGDDGDDDDGKNASDDGDDDQPKGKKSRRAADDYDDKDAEDDDEDEMKGKGAVASARRREQTRIAHILGHKAAGGNPLLAVSLACETRMTRQEAVRVLKSTPASQQASENDRPNRHARTDRNVRLGSDASAPTGRQAVQSSWDSAFAKAGVAKTR